MAENGSETPFVFFNQCIKFTNITKDSLEEAILLAGITIADFKKELVY